MVTKKNKKELKMVNEGLTFIALRDHVIRQNNIVMLFKKGMQYVGVDPKWESTLKIEKIMKEET